MSAPASTVLEIHNLLQRFVGAERTFSLHVPHLAVEAGSVNIIIGRSGCGKTTLLDVLGLIARPVAFDSFCIGNRNMRFATHEHIPAAAATFLRRRMVGYILQTGALLPFLSVRENVMLTARLAGNADTRYAEQLMERLEIAPLQGMMPGQLSIGQRQRVAIARAMAHRPCIILADEPTGALDPASAEVVRKMLVENARLAGTAVLTVTHDAELFRRGADAVYRFELQSRDREVTSTLCREERTRR